MFENLFAERGFSMDRLKALVEVSQAGSISRAVGGNSVRQSQYSRQIKELEEFFGIRLTRKKGKVLVLTSAGQELVRLACEYFSMLDEFRSNCKDIPRRYTIGGGDSIHHWLISPILSKLSLQGRSWLFAIKNLRNNEVAEMLYSMDIDFGILRKNLITADILKYKTIRRVRYALYVPRVLMPKGGKRDFAWCMENIPCSTLAFGSSFAIMLKNCCADAGIDVKIALETQSFPFAAEMLRSKNYCAILPEMCESSIDGNVYKIQPPFFKALERDIVFAWNPRLLQVRPSVKPIIDFFLREFAP